MDKEFALHATISNHPDDQTRTLILQGALVTVKDHYGRTPIDIAQGGIHHELMLCAFLQTYKQVQLSSIERFFKPSPPTDREIAAALLLFNVLFLNDKPDNLNAHLDTLRTSPRLKSIYEGVKYRLP